MSYLELALIVLLFGFSAYATTTKEAQELIDENWVDENSPYVLDEVSTEHFITEFSNKICGASFKVKLTKQCHNKWQEMFINRLFDRYKFADSIEVANKCKAYPLECHEPKKLEQMVRVFNNNAIEKYAHNTQQLLNEDHRKKVELQKEQSRQKLSEFLKAFGNSKQKNINCNSYHYGSTTNTNCSY